MRVCDTATGDVAEYELVGAAEADVGIVRVSLGAPVGRALSTWHSRWCVVAHLAALLATVWLLPSG